MNEDDFRARFKAELAESRGAYCAGWTLAETMLEILSEARGIFDQHSLWTPNQEGLPDPSWQFSRGFLDALAPAFARTIERVTLLACSRTPPRGWRKTPEIVHRLVREELLDDLRYLDERWDRARGPVDFNPRSDEW